MATGKAFGQLHVILQSHDAKKHANDKYKSVYNLSFEQEGNMHDGAAQAHCWHVYTKPSLDLATLLPPEPDAVAHVKHMS